MHKLIHESLPAEPDLGGLGHEMHDLVAELYPICRSITGNGVRETLSRLQRVIPLTVHEVSSGTRVFDWTVPLEWNIRDAYIKNSQGERIVDFQKSNLHVVSYSTPLHKKMRLEELRSHLFSLPDNPDWIPYRTSYYKQDWGFCLTHKQLLELREDEYEVCIESSLESGHLTYGEFYVRGESSEEILISAHVCHPSLANDNLSGIAVACFLAKRISQLRRKYSYRFLFAPGTIGAITWLSINESSAHQVKHGLVLAGVGDAGPLTYKKSRRGNTEIDRAATLAICEVEPKSQSLDFSPYGYDERQYCSPGFNLAIGRLSRTPHGTFPEYHTSADNVSFVRPDSLGESLSVCINIVSILEQNRTYLNTNPKCEPQLGERNLYHNLGGGPDNKAIELAMLWVLNLSDGMHSLLEIAESSRLRFELVGRAASALKEHGLLEEVSTRSLPRSTEQQFPR